MSRAEPLRARAAQLRTAAAAQLRTAAVLCGGESRRAGLDKQTLPGADGILPLTIARALRGSFPRVLLVTNRPRLYDGSGFELVEDILRGAGPLGGIHAALRACSGDYLFVIAGDMPRPDLGYIGFMMESLGGGQRIDAVATRIGRGMVEPLCAIYSTRCATPIEDFLARGGRSVGAFLRGLARVAWIEEDEARRFSPDLGMFENINTRDEVDAYLGMEARRENAILGARGTG